MTEHPLPVESQAVVLLVDDDPIPRALVKLSLEKQGFDVFEAASGAAAIEFLASRLPDIVLLDAMMPGMDGFETCMRIRRSVEGEKIPILMLTGLDDDQSVKRAYESGASDFFVKAPQLTLLSERVKFLLRSAKLQAELSASRLALAQAQRLARIGSWEWDLGRAQVVPSAEAIRILGLEPDAKYFSERRFITALYRDGLDAFKLLVYTSLRLDKPHRMASEIVLGSGAIRPVEIEFQGDRDSSGRISKIIGTIQDLSERRDAEEQMQRLASFDALTGLANRGLFRKRLLDELSDSRQNQQIVAVLAINLDGFRVINDVRGNGAGDAVLREMALRLTRSIRSRDSAGFQRGENAAVARIGGDDFVVVAKGLALAEHSERIAERLLDVIAAPVALEDGECWVRASIGIAVFPRDAEDPDVLLQRAESAMRHCKRSGGGGYKTYSPEQDEKTSFRFALERDLRKAQEKSELLLHWQPILNGRKGNIEGAEVLMRWRRGSQLIPPGEFIPLAQELGLIHSMTDWAVETACSQVAEWRSKGHVIDYVSVNFTSGHFQEPSLIPSLRHVLEKNGLAPSSLQIEITESMLMDSLDTTLRTIQQLRDSGIRLAIDDFGTGYSSLSYLKRLPVTALKIDRSFIKEIDGLGDDSAIVGAISSLATTLRLSVVAEGVETESQRDALLAQGIELMQGYLFSRPVDPEAFEALLGRQPG